MNHISLQNPPVDIDAFIEGISYLLTTSGPAIILSRRHKADVAGVVNLTGVGFGHLNIPLEYDSQK